MTALTHPKYTGSCGPSDFHPFPIYRYSSFKQLRTTQALQVLVNCISSICASVGQQKDCFVCLYTSAEACGYLQL